MTTPVAAAAGTVTGTGPITKAARKATGGGAGGAKSPRGGKPAAKKTAAKKTAPPAGKPARPAGKPAPSKGAPAPFKRFKPALLTDAGGGARKTIVAEFALCILLIGITPVVMRKPDKDGHLYVPNDIVRLSAVSLLFFVLALMANGPRSAKVAATFGALVTLGTTFNAARSIDAIGKIFATSNKNKGQTASAPAGTATVDVPVYVPTDPTSNPQEQAGQGGAAGVQRA